MSLTFKLNLNQQRSLDYGLHRAGWSYALSSFDHVRSNPQGCFFDSFIERTFYWAPEGPHAHAELWVGVIHNAPNAPPWFDLPSSNPSIFSTVRFRESLRFCRGLYTLSRYHKTYLDSLDVLRRVPVNTLIHPTEVNVEIKFDYDKFLNGERKIVQVGYWLRKQRSIYRLNTPGLRKCMLCKQTPGIRKIQDEALVAEMSQEADKVLCESGVETIGTLDATAYDLLLSDSIIFMDLYDASANNAILECIVRNTPVLVNPVGGVVEYLGDEYPFYFNSLEEASKKACDNQLIKHTKEYLSELPIKQKLTREYFLSSLLESKIYQRL